MSQPISAGIAVAPSLTGWVWSIIVGDEDGDRHTGNLEAYGPREAVQEAIVEARLFADFEVHLVNLKNSQGGWSYLDAVDGTTTVTPHMAMLAEEARKVVSLRPLMRRGVRQRADVPGLTNPDPFLVAADASLSGSGRAGWGCVTGAGWVMYDDLAIGDITCIQQAELWAVARAAAMYPPGCEINVITDNAEVAEAAKKIVRGVSYRAVAANLKWMPPEDHGPGGALHFFHEAVAVAGSVKVSWVKRETHPLQALADRYSRISTRPRREVAHRGSAA